jgi:hypothetical protein
MAPHPTKKGSSKLQQENCIFIADVDRVLASTRALLINSSPGFGKTITAMRNGSALSAALAAKDEDA